MNQQQTHALITNSSWANWLPNGADQRAMYTTLRSDWLTDKIMAIQSTGQYCSNATAATAAAADLGALTDSETEHLGTLVYFAQDNARELTLLRAGYVPATQDRLASLDGKTVHAVQNGIQSSCLLNGHNDLYRVKQIGERFVLMLPRSSRTKCLADYGDNWIKSVQ